MDFWLKYVYTYDFRQFLFLKPVFVKSRVNPTGNFAKNFNLGKRDPAPGILNEGVNTYWRMDFPIMISFGKSFGENLLTAPRRIFFIQFTRTYRMGKGDSNVCDKYKCCWSNKYLKEMQRVYLMILRWLFPMDKMPMFFLNTLYHLIHHLIHFTNVYTTCKIEGLFEQLIVRKSLVLQNDIASVFLNTLFFQVFLDALHQRKTKSRLILRVILLLSERIKMPRTSISSLIWCNEPLIHTLISLCQNM